MLNNLATGPVAGVTGGFIPPLCPPTLSPAAIAALPGGAEGAQATAAKIAADEADAKARVAAVEYLGTVDCNRWPEASKALTAALREDKTECVRFAAARVLNTGCCCSKDMIEALKVCVAGENTDGAPVETSSRVKAAAFNALQNCLTRVSSSLSLEAVPPEIPPDIKPIPEPGQPEPRRPEPETPSAAIEKLNTHVAAARFVPAPRVPTFQERLRHKTFAQTVEEARWTLFEVSRTPQRTVVSAPGSQSVLQALVRARQSVKPAPAPAAEVLAPTPDPGVRPTSYTPGSESRTPPPLRQTTAPNDEPRRGLLGSLLELRKRPAGE